MTEHELFVPGRVCLFGEHSDWAGGHRRTNSALEKGYCVISGTNQGLYARVRANPSRLVFRSTTISGERSEASLPMRASELLGEAEKGGYFSYVAGVAYQLLIHHDVAGIEIDNYRTDLPHRKGLSSSAAVCVLTARAFNRVYGLKMTNRGEMEAAYRGEITTPSRCGRMDQGCAFGVRPVLMAFDGDVLQTREIKVGGALHLVIADLGGRKDTVAILRDLNRSYPFGDSATDRDVQEYLGPINREIAARAVAAIEAGDASALGALMTEAQAGFDRYVRPACPAELEAPLLHQMLSRADFMSLTFGGKGVGSQGDGAVQFVARDRESQERLVSHIQETLGRTALPLSLLPPRRIRKAVVTAAGLGTRLYPMTAFTRKELLPVVGHDGELKPLLLQHLEDLLAAGIEQVCIVIQQKDRRLFGHLLSNRLPAQVYARLTESQKRCARSIGELADRVSLVCQRTQRGLGHAVAAASAWVGSEPFLLVLGDHLFRSAQGASAFQEMLSAYDTQPGSIIGLMSTDEQELHRYGVAGGVWDGSDRFVEINELAEKPSAEFARQNLRVEGLGAGRYLGFSGLYVLEPEVFGILRAAVRKNKTDRGEIQLTSALSELRERQGMYGVAMVGSRVDIGTPEGYRLGLAADLPPRTGPVRGSSSPTCEGGEAPRGGEGRERIALV